MSLTRQSSRSQQLARVPWDEIEQRLRRPPGDFALR
jgi:hypothetical protein